MHFIYVARGQLGVSLRTAKAWHDELSSARTLDIPIAEEAVAREAGRQFLTLGGVRVAMLVSGPTGDPEPLRPLLPPPPKYRCPNCSEPLKQKSECGSCGWLRFPSDRSNWNRAGSCPRCGFAYRWDGARCAHCGHGATEQPPIEVPPFQ
ncbi:MAG TPA: hypothetical protein VF796_28730 [Humisphaera sp.]